MGTIVNAVLIGIAVLLAGSLPRNLFFALNFRYAPGVPWAVPVTAAWLWVFWRYVSGDGPPDSTREARRAALRAHPVPGHVWTWSMIAGGLGIVALVLGLRVANRLVTLHPQRLPDLSGVPGSTVLSLLLIAAPVAGVVEEAAFRGYMQGPIERRFGLPIAILITGTMFAVAHLDFTLGLWPYYVAVAAIYGTVTSLTGSILPAVVLHTAGNIYSNLDLWLHGQAEWQAPSGPAALVWQTGPDASFWIALLAFALVGAASVGAYVKLARIVPASVR